MSEAALTLVQKEISLISEELSLQDVFSPDELYSLLIERRIEKQQLQEFRKNIVLFEDEFRTLPEAYEGDHYPLVHSFADGMYIRQITIPPEQLTTTKIHARSHPYFILKGHVSVLTENGVEKLEAPYSGITKAGTKRVIWTHDEVVWITVHSTKETDLDKIEVDVIAKNFEEMDKIDKEKIDEFVRQMKLEVL